MNVSHHLPLPENLLREWIERPPQNRFVSVAVALHSRDSSEPTMSC